MDVSSTNNIVNTVVATMVQEQSVAINVAMLKKSMDMQASASAALLQMLDPPLATSGSLWTQLNTFA